MSKTVLWITRSLDGGDGSSQRGLTVTKAPRDRFLDRLKPSYRSQHETRSAQLSRSLGDAFRSVREAKLRRVAIISRSSACLLRKRLEDQANDDALETEAFDERLKGFRISTLEMLTELSGEELIPIGMAARSSEALIRELVSYREAIGDDVSAGNARNLLNDVREASPEFALEDLSTLTGDDREQAERIIALSTLLWRRERDDIHDNAAPHWSVRDQIMNFVSKTQYVSPALAAILRERPNAIEGMPDYLQHFPRPVSMDEAEHFRAFIDAPSRALAIGAL